MRTTMKAMKAMTWVLALGAAAALASGGCESKAEEAAPASAKEPDPSPAAKDKAPAAAPAAADKAAKPATTAPPKAAVPKAGAGGPAGDTIVEGNGTLRGTISLDGTPPEPRQVLITKDEHVCGSGNREIKEVEVTAEGKLRQTVVHLLGELPAEGAPATAETRKLLQEGCRFQPYLTWVPKGGKLEIVNGDDVAHNIHAYEIIGRSRRDVLNFAQPKKGDVQTKAIKPRRGEAIQLTCDVHDFMSGWIFVPPNPWAVVAPDGTFELTGVPAGKRTVRVYHPILGTQEQQVELAAGGEARADFVFKAQ